MIHPTATPTVQVINCGDVTVGDGAVHETGRCAQVRDVCAAASAVDIPDYPTEDEVVIVTYPDRHQTFEDRCAVRVAKAAAPERVTGAMAHAAAERALPHPTIGTAPIGHVTLVNIDTVLWVNTAPDIDLPAATLLGQHVALRAHVLHVDWRFGDGATRPNGTLGRAYTDADPCTTAKCPQYFAHEYLDTGSDTITAQLTWTGQFRVGAGRWQNIPGTVTADTTPNTMTVKQARGVLVPNP